MNQSFEARVDLSPRPGIPEPQGNLLLRTLPKLGYTNVELARMGKSVRLVVRTADTQEARRVVDAICRNVLVNPLLEEYEIVDVRPIDEAEFRRLSSQVSVPARAKGNGT